MFSHAEPSKECPCCTTPGPGGRNRNQGTRYFPALNKSASPVKVYLQHQWERISELSCCPQDVTNSSPVKTVLESLAHPARRESHVSVMCHVPCVIVQAQHSRSSQRQHINLPQKPTKIEDVPFRSFLYPGLLIYKYLEYQTKVQTIWFIFYIFKKFPKKPTCITACAAQLILFKWVLLLMSTEVTRNMSP